MSVEWLELSTVYKERKTVFKHLNQETAVITPVRWNSIYFRSIVLSGKLFSSASFDRRDQVVQLFHALHANDK